MMALIFPDLMPGVFSRREIIYLSSCSLALSSGTLKAVIQEPFSECQQIKKDRAAGGRVCSLVLYLLYAPLLIACLSGIERYCENALPDKGIGQPGSTFGNVQLFVESNEQHNIKSPEHVKAPMIQS